MVQERGEPPVVQLRFAEESEPLLACTGALPPSDSSALRRDLVVRAATRALGGLYVPEGGGPATYRYSGIETAGSLEWRDASGSRQDFSGQVEV
ncbi:MAG: hypothetical protein K8H90_02800, partial [Thermoanaerobaculia bacterium]|nr:hypothetical protein [Thermoanaerobaculia bacterium]